jgi:NADH dehydrogenase/NADH:ubiquinone oxidoreductase subunit G
MILVSSTVLERTDGAAILNYIYKLGETTNLINKKEKWNGINILHNEASRVGALDLGIVPKTSSTHKSIKGVNRKTHLAGQAKRMCIR